MSMPPIKQKCDLCGKFVEVAITTAPYDFNSPSIKSDCTKEDCPINAENKPNCDEHVLICLVGSE